MDENCRDGRIGKEYKKVKLERNEPDLHHLRTYNSNRERTFRSRLPGIIAKGLVSLVILGVGYGSYYLYQNPEARSYLTRPIIRFGDEKEDDYRLFRLKEDEPEEQTLGYKGHSYEDMKKVDKDLNSDGNINYQWDGITP